MTKPSQIAKGEDLRRAAQSAIIPGGFCDFMTAERVRNLADALDQLHATPGLEDTIAGLKRWCHQERSRAPRGNHEVQDKIDVLISTLRCVYPGPSTQEGEV